MSEHMQKWWGTRNRPTRQSLETLPLLPLWFQLIVSLTLLAKQITWANVIQQAPSSGKWVKVQKVIGEEMTGLHLFPEYLNECPQLHKCRLAHCFKEVRKWNWHVIYIYTVQCGLLTESCLCNHKGMDAQMSVLGVFSLTSVQSQLFYF